MSERREEKPDRAGVRGVVVRFGSQEINGERKYKDTPLFLGYI